MLAITKTSHQNSMRLKEIFNWNQIDFAFDSEEKRLNMIETGQFILGNSIPTAIALWADKLFLAFPRFKLGIPATIGCINTNGTGNSPFIIHYPILVTISSNFFLFICRISIFFSVKSSQTFSTTSFVSDHQR